MDLKQLQAFVAIARLGSYAAAADHLHFTSSALSTRIDGLEFTLGHALFERSGRNVVLTTWGHELLPHAERMLLLEKSLRSTARLRPQFLGNRVRIGATDGFARSSLTGIVERFMAEHPNIGFDLRVGVSSHIWELLASGEIDAGFLSEPVLVPGVEIVPLETFGLIWVASPTFGAPETYRPGKWQASHIFTSRAGSTTHSAVEAFCAEREMRDVTICTLESIEAAIRFTTAGLGIALLTDVAAEPLLASGKLVEVLKDVSVPSATYFACHRQDSLSDAGAILCAYASEPAVKPKLEAIK